jgi:hypothetical protein
MRELFIKFFTKQILKRKLQPQTKDNKYKIQKLQQLVDEIENGFQ